MQGLVEVNILSLMVQRQPAAPCGEVRAAHYKGNEVIEERIPVERVCYSSTNEQEVLHIREILRERGILTHKSDPGPWARKPDGARYTIEWYIAIPRDFWGIVWPSRETQLKEARDRGIDTGYANGHKAAYACANDQWTHKLNCYRHLNVFKRVWLAIRNEVLK